MKNILVYYCVTNSRVSRSSIILSSLQTMNHVEQFKFVCRAHSPTLPSLYLRHSSFSYPPVASPTSQLILQPFFRFSYVTGSSRTSPGEPPNAFEAVGYANSKFMKHWFAHWFSCDQRSLKFKVENQYLRISHKFMYKIKTG